VAAPALIEEPLQYTEWLPSPRLAPWVVCYWNYRGTGAPGAFTRVLPDGSADILVDITRARAPLVVGAMRRALVKLHQGEVDLFGIRFRPGRALPFMHAPLEELTDRRVQLEELSGGRYRVFDRMLADALSSAPVGARIAVVERVLLTSLRDAFPPRDVVAHAVGMMEQARGRIAVRDVTTRLGVGERMLERAFGLQVGLTPKELARVIRFGELIGRLEGTPHPEWSGLAFCTGYSDQSHLIREFRRLAGVTPTAYLAERQRVGFVQDSEGDQR
jgi:AraC-like DNA-binding protein